VVGLYELLGNPRSVVKNIVITGIAGTLVYSVTKTGRHDIAEILLKVELNTINQIETPFGSNQRHILVFASSPPWINNW
jgi:hypothetical protein